MNFEDFSSFKDALRKHSPDELARNFLCNEDVASMSSSDDYSNYLLQVKADYEFSEKISIMGSGNWRFSLNPTKNFKRFDGDSDIDLVIICKHTFHTIWDELRIYHRRNYYSIGAADRERLRRHGEDVYSGFISPMWIPDRKSKTRYEYEVNANKYSNSSVGFRKVNMRFFKSIEETIDYYVRSIRLAKRGL